MHSVQRCAALAAAIVLTACAVASAAGQPPPPIGIVHRYSDGGPPMRKSLHTAIVPLKQNGTYVNVRFATMPRIREAGLAR